MRGEHPSARNPDPISYGSSPHARGTQEPQRHGFYVARFIPACAGNTGRQTLTITVDTVHPRMRGEHFARIAARCAGLGSSPHARGTQERGCGVRNVGRFIPACAGNTETGKDVPGRDTVHPRMRGEHRIELVEQISANGSSPHARGTHQTNQRIPLGTRFIPACAGNTTRTLPPAIHDPVHPRMRGEHHQQRSRIGRVVGSSPHARGTPAIAPSSISSERFIPACAGNTSHGLA